MCADDALTQSLRHDHTGRESLADAQCASCKDPYREKFPCPSCPEQGSLIASPEIGGELAKTRVEGTSRVMNLGRQTTPLTDANDTVAGASVPDQLGTRTTLLALRSLLPYRQNRMVGWKHDGFGGTDRVWETDWCAPRRGPLRWLWTEAWYKP